jgi:eukaryotic-like serine/threonine-protein kinase
MKIPRYSFLITTAILMSFLLSACGGVLINNWPGVSSGENHIYVSYQGAVYAINPTNGTVAWSFPAKAEPAKPFYAAPAVGEDLIVVGNYGHQLFGLDKNGVQRWLFEVETGNFVASPLIVNDTVLAPSSDNILYAMDLNGNQLWQFRSPNMLWAQPASDGEMVYLPALDHHLYALNLADGSVDWSVDLGSPLMASPVLDENGTIFVTNMEGELISVSAADGSENWRTPTGGRLWSTPVLHEGMLYVGNLNNRVFGISAENGQITWQMDTGDPIVGGGALLPDGVAFPVETGRLIAYSFDGSVLWNQTINGKLYTTPVVFGDYVVAAVTGGEPLLQAYNVNGQTAWQFAPTQ